MILDEYVLKVEKEIEGKTCSELEQAGCDGAHL